MELNVPAAQAVQEEAPLEEDQVPSEQAVQVEAPLDDQLPAGHSMQALTEELLLLGLYVPAEQGVHALIEVLPMVGLNFPAEQLVQEAAPLEENIPAGHV